MNTGDAMVKIYIWILVAGFAAIVIYVAWCYIRDLKCMKTGADKRKIAEIVNRVIPEY